MLTIYVARHGQNEDNAHGILNGHRDEPLTAIGVEQAHEIADKIKEAGLIFDAVYTSPLERAADTATIIAATNNAPEPKVTELLIERDFGVMTGQPQSSIESACAPDIIKTDTVTYFLSPEGAETFPDLLTRARRLLTFLKEHHSDGNILLVTHGDFGKMIYADYYHLSWRDVLTMFHFGNSDLLMLGENVRPEEAQVFKIVQFNT